MAVKRDGWAGESLSEQTRLNGRQGVRYALQEGMTVLDPQTMREMPADGQTMGEIMFRGNIVMKGYLKNPAATDEGLRRRLVPHRRPGGDGARPLREDQGPQQGHHHLAAARTSARIEVEDALYRHPAVMACAVVAQARREVGRDAAGFRRAQARRDGRRPRS